MAYLLNKKNESAPLYAQIAEDLKFRIFSEQWKTGEKIPAELTLCELYNVSRITIRKAIDELVREKLLHRERAKGTFVIQTDNTIDKGDHFTLIRSFTAEMKELGKTAATLYSEVQLVPADKKIAAYLHVNKDDSVLQLKRVRGTDNHAFAFFVTIIPYKKFYSLNSNDYYGSFYEYLKQFGISINNEKEYIEAVLPSLEVQNALLINKQEPVLKRVRMTSNHEINFYEYSECFYIGNQYRYYLEFDK